MELAIVYALSLRYRESWSELITARRKCVMITVLHLAEPSTTIDNPTTTPDQFGIKLHIEHALSL